MKLKKDQHILLRMKKKNKIKKILITGANGFIGKHLKKKLFKLYKLDTPSKKKLNLNDKKKLKLYLQKTKPEIIIHLASSTKFKKKKKFRKKKSIIKYLSNYS